MKTSKRPEQTILRTDYVFFGLLPKQTSCSIQPDSPEKRASSANQDFFGNNS